ncbi:Protein RcaC [Planktothrix tepida]|uniref:Two-component response regulator n=3 Tax=Planktothrix TaxID=54304 RepID=A0A1J1LHA5_9CYAN|nr:response regulator [Planktothrix tepida]CAD5926075.1 Protein RcaC [Planktothrix tepida]CAD5981303.1 Protein RcaC [Planktothrix pseudagardhii]CUR31268.1 Two-component response regulator [Planktothrix tepida PCC 9214]
MRILLVEDDSSFATMIQELLSHHYYLVDVAYDGEMGWKLAEAFEYDLILLDLMLPKLDGLNFCKKRRQKDDRTPILLITGEDNSTTKVAGLDAGADDYLVKPFDLEELLARIRALLRRGHDALNPLIEWGLLNLDPSNCQVTYGNQCLNLTAKEYALLELFLRYPQRIFSQASLLDHLWSYDEPPSENAVRTHIKSLRKKLKNAGANEVIETIYGLGYRLKEMAENSLLVKSQPPVCNSKKTQSLNLNQIWQKQKYKYFERINIIENAVQSLKTNAYTLEIQQKALMEAHTLVGSLGAFGFKEASNLSRQIEQLLKAKYEKDELDYQYLSDLIQKIKDLLNHPLSEPSSSISPPPLPFPYLNAPKLLIVDDDQSLAEALVTEALAKGIMASATYSPEQARQKLQHNFSDVVLLDLSFPESTESGFELLAELAIQNPPIPVIVFTAQESFADRVKVARLGGRGFLQKPISPAEVIETVSKVLQKSQSNVDKLLIVDDNLEILDWLRTVLQPWGLQLILLDDPQQFWSTLEQSNPDLLILGIHLPGVSGVELCQVVRNDPKWNDLPVLMLSSQRDSEIVQQVFMAGADDYIQKPIVEPELIARVFNRLERSQLRRKIVAQCYLGTNPNPNPFKME